MRLHDKTAIITGASGDLGSVTALECAKQGARAIGVHYSSSAARANKLVAQLHAAGTQAAALQADVSKSADVQRIFKDFVAQFGRLDIVIAMAGYPISHEVWFADPLKLSEADLDAPWNVDVKGSYHCIRHAVPYMRKQRYGKLVLISSTPGVVGDATGLQFSLAKSANRLLVRSLAPRLGRFNITLNAIAPGTFGTETNLSAYRPADLKAMLKSIPLGRFGKPAEIAKVAAFLASDDASYITGQTLIVDGGEVTL